jgi:hypothetical protein
MDHAEAREILELAAVEPNGLARLTAGDTPEAMALAGHLAGCSDCTQELARLRRVAHVVGGVVRSSPPPDLRDRTLAFVRAVGRDRSAVAPATAVASTAATAAIPARAPAAVEPRPRARTKTRWPELLAIAAALVLAVAGVGYGISQSNAAAQQAEIGRDLAAITAGTMRVESQPDAQRIALASTSGSAEQGIVLFSPRTRELVVVASGLTQPPSGYEYRCWVETNGTRSPVGKMFFGGGVSYWLGPVDAVGSLSDHARFGVSLVNVGSGTSGDPVLSGQL